MTAGPAFTQMTDEAFAALRARPGFRRACEAAAAESVAQYRTLTPTQQWVTRDLGRAAISVTAAILHYSGELTVQGLTAHSVRMDLSSPGRVNQVVRRAQEGGEFSVDDGPGLWTRRPARLGAGLRQALHERGMVDMRAALTLAPELSGVLDILDTHEGQVSALMWLAAVSSTRRDLFTFSEKRPLNFFLDREAGMLVLFDLLSGQSPDRDRLLEAAPLSRYALSQRYGVSRAHINKLLAESGHTDAVGDRVHFSEVLSEAVNAHFALIFQHQLGAAQMLLEGWRYGPDQAGTLRQRAAIGAA
ncbi:MAG TPA: hypothetical protein VGG29_05340 [Caulobacteraceae bacterium]|jgi:hypothetical protein